MSYKNELSQLIPPEIKNDEFYAAIQKIASKETIKNVLEIGSSSGTGSTEAFVAGLRENPNKPALFCMEVSQERFTELKKRYENYDFVKCYNISSVAIDKFPDEGEITTFYNRNRSNLNAYSLERVIGWLRQDIEYVKASGVAENGIELIKKENNIDFFDAVLIDGSEFTGIAELKEVYGAKFILLDDINTYKNRHNHDRLVADDNYVKIAQNDSLRNGYSIFKRIDRQVDGEIGEKVIDSNSFYENYIAFPELPIHFFTIVLNGEPFIRYHIEVFKQLSFKWHWHIIEGVADLKHDTAWSLKSGGEISDDIHRHGRSNDGTTEYLDELAQLYPDNVTIYRQPEGLFWDGKREMTNAPLSNISEECLLWQVDVDELWTVEQLCTGRKMFVQDLEKTAAFFWCWYFVGENLVISTRNCYAQNPQQDWLRVWRFKPGYFWAAHEPPILAEPLADGQFRNVAAINSFKHEETEKQGLIFQHFAYVMPNQLQFKERYYGYKNAIFHWQALQSQKQFPVKLGEYFPWVGDGTMVDTARSCGVVPIARKDSQGNTWKFVQPAKKNEKQSPIVIVDGVFFQLYNTGIARVWRSLLEEWAANGFAKHIVVLDRAGTAPKVPGIWYRAVPAYDYGTTEGDREMLQQVCDAEGAELFISTYYTTPLSTPSIFMAYDMIPEVMGWDLNQPMWREKHRAIAQASAYLAISENTARDLAKLFPQISQESVRVAHCGVQGTFAPATSAEINSLRTKYGISKPYFIVVGVGGYKNTILFLQAFAQLHSKIGFEIVLTAQGSLLQDELRSYTSGSVVHMLRLSDEELKAAYSGAVALVYPSKYEGFGLPVLEALSCGCPVITCRNASIPEVAGEAAIYVSDADVNGLANALCDVQKPEIRRSLIAAGFEQAKKFSWSKMSGIMSSALIEATLLRFNLRAINLIIFPDWNQPEESLGLELVQAIEALVNHPDKSQITLLVDRSNISDEDVDLALSTIVMNILMSEDLDVSEGPEISVIGQLAEIQWQAIINRIHARIILENQNQEAIADELVKRMPTITSDDLSKAISVELLTSKTKLKEVK